MDGLLVRLSVYAAMTSVNLIRGFTSWSYAPSETAAHYRAS